MKRVALVIVLGLLGCRRTHPPGPGSEPEPQAPSSQAVENAPAGEAVNAPPASAPATSAAPARDERFRMPDGGTMNGDPRGPRPNDVKRILDGALNDVRPCFDNNADVKMGDTPITVHFFVEPPGYTGGVTVTADAPKEALDCTRAVYDKLKFPEFKGNKLELAPQFTYWKRARDGGAK